MYGKLINKNISFISLLKHPPQLLLKPQYSYAQQFIYNKFTYVFTLAIVHNIVNEVLQ